MPWKDKTVEELRREFGETAEREEMTFSELCRIYGITRKTGYQWVERYQNNEELSDRSRRPTRIANKTPEETELLIVELRTRHPGWGAKKIREVLTKEGHTMPCTKTVNNILHRYGCISKESSMKHKPYKRFEKEACNELWQADFKGEFKMQNGEYCYPLDIIDDHSRYLIRIAPKTSTADVVIPVFREAFLEYGMPETILVDNGPQFGGYHQGFTQFEKWLMNHDILPIHGRVRHPQTQGKIERLHRSMKDEVLEHYTPSDIEDAERVLSAWRELYNTVRPHEALKMRCPVEVYTPSTKEYVDPVQPYEYNGANHVIKVNSWGYVRFDRWQIYLSETMIGEQIEFRHHPDGERFIACYRNFAIAEFDVHNGQCLHRSISRV